MPGFNVSKALTTPPTILLGANGAGDLKLKPMLIEYFKTPRILKNYAKSTLLML